MRLFLAALCISAYASMASAQTQLDFNRLSASQPINGEATSPENKQQAQPQGPAGPLTTGKRRYYGGQSSGRYTTQHAGCSGRFIKEQR
jgi:hypothetical protein